MHVGKAEKARKNKETQDSGEQNPAGEQTVVFLFGGDECQAITQVLVGVCLDPFFLFTGKVIFFGVVVMFLDELFLAALDFPPFPKLLAHGLHAGFYIGVAVLLQVTVPEFTQLFVPNGFVGFKPHGLHLGGAFLFPPLVKNLFDVGFPLPLLDFGVQCREGVETANGKHQSENDVVVDLESLEGFLDCFQ